MVRADGTSLNQISGFTDPTNGFPHGALYSPSGDALVAAGTIFGTNGLWIISLSPDGTDCEGMPIRLPTSPGDSIDFAGTIILGQSPPLRFARRDADQVVVFWRTDVGDFTLETSHNLALGSWTELPKPYPIVSQFFEYRVPGARRRA